MPLPGYDNWLNSGNPADEEEPQALCHHCGNEFGFDPSEYSDCDEDGYSMTPPTCCPDCQCPECGEEGELVEHFTVDATGAHTLKLCSQCAHGCVDCGEAKGTIQRPDEWFGSLICSSCDIERGPYTPPTEEDPNDT